MDSHPLNLFVRFMLEIIALVAIGFWGWQYTNGWLQYILAIGLPFLLAAIWGIFAVPNDPSRSGKAPIATPGFIRLGLELGFFALATWFLYDMEHTNLSLAFASTVALHYAISYNRIAWLIKQ
jgi:hypothetical protein